MSKENSKGILMSKTFLLKFTLAINLIVFFLIGATLNASAGKIEGNKQGNKITGTVKAADTGEPLPGVYVVIKGTNTGVATDVDGKFTIETDQQQVTLTFSFVGYVSEDVVATPASPVEVSLSPNISNLQEVVVIGYGVQQKVLNTGAISQVKSDDIDKTNIARPEQALMGRTAGVQVVPQSGAPGAGMNVRVRGYGTNGNSSPLFVVDGVQTGDINYLDPNDIATIDVLKDAASAAIYGAQGGNGVVIITTKKGAAGKTHVSYDFKESFETHGKLPKLMNTNQYMEYMSDTNVNGARTPLVAAPDANNNTDWLGAIFETGHTTSHHLAFSGGSEKSSFLLSANYYKNDGIIVGNKDIYTRYTVRFNSDHQMNKWLKVGDDISYARFSTKGINENGGEFGGMIGSALQLDPTTPIEFPGGVLPGWLSAEVAKYNHDNGTSVEPVKAPDGNYYGVSQNVAGEIINPLISRDNQTGVYTQDKLLGNIYAEIKPIEGLTITSRLGLDFAIANNHYWTPKFYYDATNLNTSSHSTDTWDHYYTWMWDNYASYNKKFGDHNITLLAGMEAKDYVHKNLSGNADMLYPTGNFDYANYSDHVGDRVSGSPYEAKLLSYFGRFNYDFKGKYLLMGSLRRDGAGESQVPVAGRWGLFPAVSAGWVISNESFFPKTFLTSAKLRGSWGQNGNISSIGENLNFAYNTSIATTYNGQPIDYPLANGTIGIGAEPGYLPDPNLTWETDEQLDFGLDLRALNDRLTFSFDYYKKTTKDLLFVGIPPATAGNRSGQNNGGEVENKGFEFDLGYRNQEHELKYSIDLNLSTLKNNVTKLASSLGKLQPGASVGTGWTNATVFEPGHQVYHFYGYKTDGIDPATGEPIFVTRFGNDTSYKYITSADKQDIGNPIPNLIFGGNVNLEYKGFDFTLTFAGQSGNKILMGWLRSDKVAENRPTVFYDNRWRKAGDNASEPSAYWSANTFYSDLLIFNGSFLRVQTIQLGYTIPPAILKKADISSLRLFVSLDNFFTFTKYPGMDPQPTVANNAANNIGIDRGTYPMAKDVMIGASISF